MIFGRMVVGGCAKDNSSQKQAQQQNQQPERKLILDHFICI